jgi:GNAT superfamily N-acetyltransferase
MPRPHELTVGFIGLRDGTHLQHLFVEPQYQGQGIASKLWVAVLDLCRLRGIEALTVNASRKAIPIYQAWSFEVSNSVQIAAGVQSTPMRLSLH